MAEIATPIYRNIVQDAVEDIFGNEALWLGMELWDKHFAKDPSPSIKAFSQQLCEHLQRPDAHSRLYTTLLGKFFLQRNQQRSHDKAVQTPLSQTQAAVQATTMDPMTVLTPSAVLFVHLVRELFAQLGFQPNSRTDEYGYTQAKLRTLIGALPMDMEKRVFWTQVLLKGELIKLRGTSERELKELFHNLYVASVEIFGPIETDQALTEAVQIIERTPQARRYSPRNFL